MPRQGRAHVGSFPDGGQVHTHETDGSDPNALGDALSGAFRVLSTKVNRSSDRLPRAERSVECDGSHGAHLPSVTDG
nr:hypothetical protein GCM10020241_38330 [Streptoalloteichus tenebrarius]